MHARQTTFQADPAKIEDGIRFFREQALPGLRQMGARSALLLADRQTGKVTAISLWESAEAAQTAETTGGALRAQGTQILGAAAPTAAVFEVIVMEDF